MSRTRGGGKLRVFWREWGTLIELMAALYVVWKWVLPILGIGGSPGSDSSSSSAGSVGSMIRDVISRAVRKVTSSSLAGATPTDLANFQADANALAEALGTKKDTSLLDQGTWSEDETAAVAILKKYRSFMIDPRPGPNKGRHLKKKEKYTYRSLSGFYSDITKGRSIEADCRKYLNEDAYKQIIADVFG